MRIHHYTRFFEFNGIERNLAIWKYWDSRHASVFWQRGSGSPSKSFMVYRGGMWIYIYIHIMIIYVICTRSQLYALILTATHQLCLGKYFTNCCKKLYVEKTFRRLHPGIQFQKGIGRVSVDIYERSHFRSHHFRLDRFVGKKHGARWFVASFFPSFGGWELSMH